MTHDITISACPHPFSTRRYDRFVAAGGNLEQILKEVDLGQLLNPAADVRLFVDDRLIGRQHWSTLCPDAGQSIAVRVVPTGGGGGKNVLRAVMFIAVVALSVYTGGLAGAAYGSVVGGVVSAGVGIAGALAVNALVPPPGMDAVTNAGAGVSQTHLITGVRNRANPYGPVQRLFGQHKLYPTLGAMPYTENYGADSYLRMLFCIGKGDYDLTDYKIGETALTSFTDYTVSDGDKDAIADLYPNDVHEAALSVELQYASGWYQQTTQTGCEEITVDVTLSGGIFRVKKSNGKIKSLNTGYEVEYSVKDAGSWTAFPGSPFSLQAKIQHRHAIAFRVTGLSANQYDVRVKKTIADYNADSPPSNSTFGINTSYWTALRSIKYAAPVELAGCHLVAIRIKATGQLNGIIDQFNCVATSKLSAWTGSAWASPAATRNPAWAYAEVLRGDSNKRPIADAAIDGDDLKTWADACTSQSFYFDAIIDRKTTVFEMLGTIAAAGRASRAVVDNKYTVIIDASQSTPRQHFSPRNSWGFKGRKIFQDIPHALKCRFINSESNYQHDEIFVYDDGYNSGNATVFETMEFTGITTTDHIWRLARYHIACARLRPETYEINVDVEHLVCTRGDLVRLTHDVLLVGLGAARIKSISGSDVTMDDFIPMEAGKTYGAQIRKTDGTMLNTTITLDAGEQTTITLASVTGIAVGDMIFFGETGSISSDCIITRIEPGADLSAKLTLVDYAAAVLTADGGTIPDYDPNITHPPEINRVPPTPTIESVSLLVWSGPTGEAKIKELLAVINYSMGIATDIAPAYYQTQWRSIDTDGGTFYSAWAYGPDVPAEARQFRIPVADGVTYDFRVRAVSQYGATSAWVTESNYVVTYAPTVPNDVGGLALIQGGSTWSGLDCEIKWTVPEDLWRVTKFLINVYKTSGLTLLRTEYVDVGQLFYSYGFVKNSEDNAGSPIGGLTIRIWAVSQHDEPSSTYDELVVTHSAPSSVTSLAGTPWAGGVEFNWDENSDAAFSHFEYRVKVGAALNGESWLRTQNPHLLRMLTSAEKDTYGAAATIYCQVKAVDAFGTASGVSSTSQAASSLNIKVTDIDDFAVTASKIFTKIPIITGDTWTDDSPDTDSVTWNSHSLIFNGVAYSITGSNSNQKYIYWDKNDVPTTYHGTDTHPADAILDDDAFIIAVNIDGTHDLAWNAIANQVIGSAFIQNLAVQNAHINDLSAAKINTGTLDADRIGATSILLAKLGSDATDRMFTSDTRDYSDIGGTKPPANADVTDYEDYRISNSQTDDAITNILNPQGGNYSYVSGDITGVIKITLPQGWSGTMLKFEVDVFIYTPSASFTIQVGGYTSAGSSAWLNEFAQIKGNTESNNRVRFGHDGSNCVIVIGETSSSWSYPKITVKNLQASHTNYTVGDWDDGWAVTVTSSLSGITFTGDFSDALLDAKEILGQGLLAKADDLDDVPDGSSWAKVAITSITGGKIIVAGLDSGVTTRMFTDATARGNIEAWRHASDVTLIDGGDIYADSITLGKMFDGFTESYGNIIGDPTFALTQDASDTSYHSLGGNWNWVSTYSESGTGPGLQFIEDGASHNNIFCDGAGAYKYIPLSKNEKILVQVRAIKDGNFDGNIVLGLWQYDKNKSYLAYTSVTLSLTTAWDTHTAQIASTRTDCHFVLIGFNGNGGTATYGYVKIDSVHAQVEPAANFRHASDVTLIDGGDIHASSSIAIGPATTWQSDGIQLDYNSGNPRFYCGDGSNNYLQFDGTNLELSTSKADAIVIKSGGDIKLESGGDLKLYSATGGSTSEIEFHADSRTIYMGVNYDGESLNIIPDTDNTGAVRFGTNYGGTIVKFSYFEIRASHTFIYGSNGSIDISSAGIKLGHTFPDADSARNLGTSSVCWLNIYGDAGVTSCSDRKYKTNINQTRLGLDFINSLVPVSFEWNKSGQRPKYHAGTYHGLIAPEVEQSLIEAGYDAKDFAGIEKNADEDGEIWYGLKYEQFIAPIIKSIQQLNAKIQDLKPSPGMDPGPYV